MRIPGKVVITRPSSNRREDYISIQITDERSLTRFVEVEISLENFARCVTSQTVECVLDVRGLEKVGMVREHKTEFVNVPRSATAEQRRAAVAEFEVDGWRGRDDDAGNMHKYVSGRSNAETLCFSVHFERHVAASLEEPAAQ